MNKEIRNPSLVKSFAQRHGMLWHQPEEGADCRETWQSWLAAGYELSLTAALYVKLRKVIAAKTDEDAVGPRFEESLKSLRAFLRTRRDIGNAHGGIPEDDEKLLERVSVLIAQRITEGLAGCSPTVIAACSLKRSDGTKEGPAGAFRGSINPSSLVAVAYNELATLIEERAWFKECVGCGKLFRLNPSVHHRDRTYCEDTCYDRTRKRNQRAKKRPPV